MEKNIATKPMLVAGVGAAVKMILFSFLLSSCNGDDIKINYIETRCHSCGKKDTIYVFYNMSGIIATDKKPKI